MTEIRLEVFGEEVIARRLSRFGENVSDFKPLFENIMTLLEGISAETFATQDSGAWPALSPKYAEWKNANYPGKPLMRLTDRLYQSLTTKGSGSVRQIQQTSMRFGTTVPYAAMHQSGGGTLPRRRVVHLVEDDKKKIMKEVHRFVVAARDDGGTA